MVIKMSEAIIVALITGCLTLAGTVITVHQSSKKTSSEMTKEIAVIKTEMKELTREVREHNNFAQRIPVVEMQLDSLEKRLAKVEG